MTGLAMVAGSLGSVLTSTPVQAILPSVGWRNVFWLMVRRRRRHGGVDRHVSVRDKPPHTACAKA
jgi:hypothetical protein